MEEIRTVGFDNRPDEFTRDRRGVKIEVGHRVAYNRSGIICLGKIIDFKAVYKDDSHYKWRLVFSMTVEGEDGKTSTLKNPNSFIIM